MVRGKRNPNLLRVAPLPVSEQKPSGPQDHLKNLVRAEQFTPGVERATVLLTPAAAAGWMQLNVSNRPLRQRYVQELAHVILDGGWVYDANPIRFDTEGNLIDGQHRLEAVRLAGAKRDNVAVPSDVVANLDPAAKNVIDTGVPRSMSDVLYMKQQPYAHQLGAVLRVLHHWYASRMRTYGRERAPHPVLLEFYEAHPEVMASVRFISMRFTRLAPASAMGALHYLFSQIDQDETNLFFEQLATGAGMNGDDPVMVLREKLIRGRSYETKGPEKVVEVVALTTKAWNYRRKRRTVKLLFWKDSGVNAEAFPEPV